MEERVGSGSLRHTLGHAKGFDLDLSKIKLDTTTSTNELLNSL